MGPQRVESEKEMDKVGVMQDQEPRSVSKLRQLPEARRQVLP